MLGARGRDDALFGGDLDAARDAFCRMTPDANLIHAYFEMPLQGDPGLDVHCAVTCEQVETALDVGAGGAWRNALAWFCDAGPFLTADEAFLMAEADTSAGRSMQSGMYLIQGARKDLVEPFLSVVGEHEKFATWERFLRRLPTGWDTTYTGLFPGRAERLLRVNTRPVRAEAVRVREALGSLGVAYDDGVLDLCRELVSCVHNVDVQLDVDEDGCPRGAFGLEFSLQGGGMECTMDVLENAGLADGRWCLAADACRSMRIALPGAHGLEPCLVSVRPFSTKFKVFRGKLQPAKLYLRGDASFERDGSLS